MVRTTTIDGGVRVRGRTGWRAALVAACVLPFFGTSALHGQDTPNPFEADLTFEARVLDREVSLGEPLIADTRSRYIVVHLEENRVYVFEGSEAIWSSPSGTGTGLSLGINGEKRWDFDTPRGLFKVKRMERDPVWIAPDWHFIEKGLAVPPWDHPSRRIPGGMGDTALYLGDGIAIHGTEQPALLLNPDPDARRVSHGCIRLTNEAARELMHMVEVGTPVLIY
jgi:lipoprotein-anchoring transpeptidase ErfK/SrfK